MNKGLSRRSKESVFSVLPAGIVMPFAGETAPEGWTFCDGSTLLRADFPELFGALGTAHGNGDGSTTFHLPDYRGRFLRGYDGVAGRDPDSGSRAASNAGGNSGNNLGSVQGDGTRNVFGVSSSTSVSPNQIFRHLNSPLTLTGLATNGYSGTHPYVAGNTALSSSAAGNTASTSSSLSGGNAETRSINANVNYIIKT